MVISAGIPAVPRNRKPRNSVVNPSAEGKTTRNSVPLNKNRSKLSEFPSEHFSGRENSSEFRSVETKIEAYSQNSLSNPSAEEKTTRNSVPWKKYRNKLSEFRSEPFRGRETCLTQNAAHQNVKKWAQTTFEVRRNHCALSVVVTRVRSLVRLHFFAGFRSVLFRSELRNWLFRGTRNASE
jgi:hypothetical protein